LRDIVFSVLLFLQRQDCIADKVPVVGSRVRYAAYPNGTDRVVLSGFSVRIEFRFSDEIQSLEVAA
jgi:hypothetical protein